MAWRLISATSEGATLQSLPAARSLRQRPWDWFDGLGNLQTVALLSGVLLGLVTLTLVLALHSVPAQSRSATPVEAPAVLETVPDLAVAPPAPASRAGTVLVEAHLRASPSLTAPILTTLATDTLVVMLDERTVADNITWQHVRTDDGRVGWVVATALD